MSRPVGSNSLLRPGLIERWLGWPNPVNQLYIINLSVCLSLSLSVCLSLYSDRKEIVSVHYIKQQQNRN